MAKALKKLSPYWFILPNEPEENPTRFKIKPLNGEEKTEICINNKIVGYDDNGAPIVQTDPRSVALAIKYGVIDWENFTDGENELEYSALNKKYIDYETRLLLAAEVVTNSTLDPETEKKS